MTQAELNAIAAQTAILAAPRTLWDFRTICLFAQIGQTKGKEIIAEPSFPSPIGGTRCRRWWSDEVRNWFRTFRG